MSLTAAGRLFHARDAATGNEWSPRVVTQYGVSENVREKIHHLATTAQNCFCNTFNFYNKLKTDMCSFPVSVQFHTNKLVSVTCSEATSQQAHAVQYIMDFSRMTLRTNSL